MPESDIPSYEKPPEVVMPDCPCRDYLKGQVAIVTGGSSGIGKGSVYQLSAAGAAVVVNYIGSADAANEIVDELKGKGGDAIAVQADVSKEEDVVNMFQTAKDKFGTVDILVNNAGLQRDAPLHEMTLQQWNTVISVNLTGQFLCAREAVKEFLRRGIRKEVSCAAGKIICMSSVHELIPWSGHVNYAASKGGVMMMMKSMSQELAPQRIRINSICPGAIRTPINTEAWNTKEAYDALMTLVPYRRIGEVEDIGRAVVWLASDESDYINGVSMFIDGGMTLFPGFASGG